MRGEEDENYLIVIGEINMMYSAYQKKGPPTNRRTQWMALGKAQILSHCQTSSLNAGHIETDTGHVSTRVPSHDAQCYAGVQMAQEG